MNLPFLFDMLPLTPLTYEQWRLAYSQRIRVRNWVSKFQEMEVGLHIVGDEEEIYLPWYKDAWGEVADFTSGTPVSIWPGSMSLIVRLPAVLVARKFLVLDGCNRLTELRPRVIVLDYLEPTRKQRLAFLDLQNNFWRGFK